MHTITILSISIILQLIAVFIAFRLIKITQNYKAWILIAIAILFMALRRIVTLISIVLDIKINIGIIFPEYIALIISVLMTIGLILIIPLFKSIKENEKKIKASNFEIQSIFRSAPVGIGLVVNRKFLQVNEMFCEMLGYTKNELLDKDSLIIYPSIEDYENVGIEKYLQISEKGTGTVETRFKKKNGEIIDVILSSTPLDLSDLSKGLTFSALDITKRKNIVRALRESEERFKNFIGSMDDLVFVFNTEKIISFYHSSDESKLYVKPDFFLGKDLSDVMPPEVSVLFNNAFEQVKHNKSSNFEYPLEMQGETCWFNLQLSPIFTEDCFKGAIAVIRDISILKQAENKLLESAKLWEDTFRSTADGIMILDKEHTIIQANRQMSIIYNFKTDQLIGKKCWEIVHKTESFIVECPFECTKNTAKRETMDLEFDGKWYRVSTDPIFDNSGVIAGAVHIMSDITRQKTLDVELQNLNKELEQRVIERTEELETSLNEVERMNKLFIGREIRIKELRDKIKKLEKK